MFRFWKNVVSCLFIVGIIVYYCIQRISPAYDSSILSNYDGLYQEIIGGLIFMTLLIILLRPSITICSHFANLPEGHGELRHLRLKIVNNSIFKAYDLQINVCHKETININGPDLRSSLIGSYQAYQVGIPYLESGLLALMEKEKSNAAQFRMSKMLNEDVDLKKLLDDQNSYLEVHVIVRHGLSGIKANFAKKYYNSSVIKTGYFAHGFSTAVEKYFYN